MRRLVRKLLPSVGLLLLNGFLLSAQELSLSTNALGYANMGTMNITAAWGFSRHFSAETGVRYNPFTFPGREGVADVMHNRQRTLSAGLRFWPWHIHSGWWLGGKAQYQEYNIGGITEPEAHEGDRYGFGLIGGYTYMLSPHFNLELGAGAWAGHESYTVFECPECGRIVDNGNRTFFLPDELLLGLVYVF